MSRLEIVDDNASSLTFEKAHNDLMEVRIFDWETIKISINKSDAQEIIEHLKEQFEL